MNPWYLLGAGIIGGILVLFKGRYTSSKAQDAVVVLTKQITDEENKLPQAQKEADDAVAEYLKAIGVIHDDHGDGSGSTTH